MTVPTKNLTNVTYRFFVEKLGDELAAVFIGDEGELFYDPNTGILRLSDGMTPGGIPITTGTGAATFDPTLYYTIPAIDAKFAALLGDADAQGDTLGELQDAILAAVPLTGATMSGPIYYAPMPVGASELTNKNYVDTKINSMLTMFANGLTTTQVPEGVNLYWTQGRFDNALSLKTTDSLAEGVTNKYWTQARADSLFSTHIANTAMTPGIVRSVNGIAPDSAGALALSLSTTVTGNVASRPAFADDGTLYVVVGDSDANNDGTSYVWANTSQQWVELAPADTATNDARYVNTSGDTMAGLLTLSANPTANLHAATKQYVDSITHMVGDLTDANTAGAANGQALVYQNGTWIPATPVSTLAGLTDTNTTGVIDGQVLSYANGVWVAANTSARISELLDVSVNSTTLIQGAVLTYDVANSEWVATPSASAPTVASLLDTQVTPALLADGDQLYYDANTALWKTQSKPAAKAHRLPDMGHGWGRSFVYGNEVFVAGSSLSERIHGWSASSDVYTTYSAPFEERPDEIVKMLESIAQQHVIGVKDGVRVLYSRGDDDVGSIGTGGSPGAPANDSRPYFAPNKDPNIYGPGINVLDIWSHRRLFWETTDLGSLWVLVDDNGTEKLYAAGFNGSGILGSGGTTNQGSLTQGYNTNFSGLNGVGVAKIDAHSSAMMLVAKDGTLWGAGNNTDGWVGSAAIGVNSLQQSLYADGTPVADAVDAQVDYIRSIGICAWFLRADGTVWGSGHNHDGGLGIGTSSSVTKYSQVLTAAGTPITNVVKILSVGRGQVFMLKDDGTVWATGRNHDGVFGNSTYSNYTTVGNYAVQIQTGIEEFWSTGGNSSGWCQVFWRKTDGKLYFSGTNTDYSGGVRGALDQGVHADLTLVDVFSNSGEKVVNVMPLGAISEGSVSYRGTIFLTDAEKIYVAGQSGTPCFIDSHFPHIFIPRQITDYVRDGESVVTRKELVVADAVAEYGEEVLAANHGFTYGSTGSPQTEDILSFTLPSAGVWEVTQHLYAGVGGTGAWVTGFITDTSNNVIPNSMVIPFYSNPSTSQPYPPTGLQGSSSMTVRITTTGAQTFKLRATSYSDPSASVIISDSNGKTKVTWNKIGQFVPFSSEAQFVFLEKNTEQTLVASGTDISFDLMQSAGMAFDGTSATLKAGVTYELRADVACENYTSTDGFAVFKWVDASGTDLPHTSQGLDINPSSTAFAGDRTNNVPAIAVITPSQDMTVKLRATGVWSGTCTVRDRYTTASIKAIAKQLPVVVPESATRLYVVDDAQVSNPIVVNVGESAVVTPMPSSPSFPLQPAKLIRTATTTIWMVQGTNANWSITKSTATTGFFSSATVGYSSSFRFNLDTGEINFLNGDGRFTGGAIVEVTLVTDSSV